MDDRSYAGGGARSSSFFYGWYIVGVGILVNIAGTFAFSSTLSIFLKPITEELGVSRGAFSLIRTFEIGVAALIVPLLGPWIDRHGGRGVLVLGVLMEGTGLLLSSLVQNFWQFVLVRCSLVIAGEALLGSLVMNVTIAQWFVRKRGRAMGIANLGTGVAKFTIPLCAASLFVLVGWRNTWAIFGIVAPLLVVVPALIFMRRRPEDIGLYPDGEPPPQSPDKLPTASETSPTEKRRALAAERSWSRSEVIRLPTFWLLVITFGIASVGIAGLNLHIFSYVTDIGYSPLIAASFMSTIAAHTTRLNAHLGCARRPIRYQEGFLCSVYDPGSGVGGRHIERRYFSRLCRLFSLRHRSGRKLRASRSHLGQLLRPHLSGNGARTIAFLFKSIRRQWCAVFRFSPRSHG